MMMKGFSKSRGKLNEKLNIILVDDKPYFRRGVKDLLLSSFPNNIAIIEEVSNGKDFLLLMDKFKADLVFIDIEIPEINGIEATSMAKAKYPDLKIFALTAHDDLHYIKSMNNAGVDGFISKNEEFTKRLEVIIMNYTLYDDKKTKESSEIKMDMLLAGLVIECPIKKPGVCPLNEVWDKPYNERINFLRRLSKIEKLEIILQHKKCMLRNKEYDLK